ncbi:hypothetical protein Ac2012v2_003521 [Leucoagaricus gongylophorus]
MNFAMPLNLPENLALVSCGQMKICTSICRFCPILIPTRYSRLAHVTQDITDSGLERDFFQNAHRHFLLQDFRHGSSQSEGGCNAGETHTWCSPKGIEDGHRFWNN